MVYEGDSGAVVVAAAAVIPAGEHDGFALVFLVWAGIRAGGDALWILLGGGFVAALPAKGGHRIRVRSA